MELFAQSIGLQIILNQMSYLCLTGHDTLILFKKNITNSQMTEEYLVDAEHADDQQQANDFQEQVEVQNINSDAMQQKNVQDLKSSLQKVTNNYENNIVVVLNEECQQKDNQKSIYEIQDQDDGGMNQNQQLNNFQLITQDDQEIYESTFCIHHYIEIPAKQLDNNSQSINRKQQYKKEAKQIHIIQKGYLPKEIFLVFKFQLEFIKNHKYESPLGQLMNIGQIKDERLIWYINYYDKKVRKEGFRFYVNQEQLLCQKRIGENQFKFLYLKPAITQ
ncbi:hypothetical protein pb186bvf_016252 [Paramecium bursaria]